VTAPPEMGSRRWAAERLRSLLVLDCVADWLDAVDDQQLRTDLADVITRARLIASDELEREALAR
jgi:hypothetical protein